MATSPNADPPGRPDDPGNANPRPGHARRVRPGMPVEVYNRLAARGIAINARQVQQAFDALDLVRDEDIVDALRRRGLKRRG